MLPIFIQQYVALICYTTLIRYVTGCEHQVWYQTIPEIETQYYKLELALNPDECARNCYQSASTCKSVIFEPMPLESQSDHFKGYCKYSFWQFNCNPEVALISNYRKNTKIIIFCIHCWRAPEILPPTSTILRTTENLAIQQGNDLTNFAEPNVKYFDDKKVITLRVMSFNTWNSGSNIYNGLAKIARHISAVQPDIVGLQEMYDDRIFRLLHLLNYRWQKCSLKTDSNYILTRFPILAEHSPSPELTNSGCHVQLLASPSTSVHVWNVHLDYRDYGPYVACDALRFKDSNSLYSGEYRPRDPTSSRLDNILNLANSQPFRQHLQTNDNVPVVLMGDLNSPSHLDWIEDVKYAHCNWSFIWPVTKFIENLGFSDSYRVVNPDVRQSSGNTWSPVYKSAEYNTPEPQDRIDFVYYAGRSLKPTRAFVYNGTEPITPYPLHFFNDWPSDHNAVVVDFEITVPYE